MDRVSSTLNTEPSLSDVANPAPGGGLSRQAGTPLSTQLAERIAHRIRDRWLAPGARLPSVRQCAQQQGISPSTVVAAYDQLLAHGLIEARRNRGFFVRERAPLERVTSAAAGPVVSVRPAPVNAATLIRGMFHSTDERPQPGMGVFPPDWLASDFMAPAVRRVTNSPGLSEASLRYGDPLGDGQLRRALSTRLRGLGLDCPPNASSPPWVRRTPWTSSAGPCSSRATQSWSRSPAGPWSLPAFMRWACASCRYHAVRRGRTWP